MNPLEDVSDFDEELQRQLECIHVDGSYLYNESSLFGESEDAVPSKPIDQQQSADPQETLQVNSEGQPNQRTTNAQSIEIEPAVPKQKTSNFIKAKPVQLSKRTQIDDQRQLKRSVSHRSVDPMRLVKRSMEWANDKKTRLLDNQRQKHRNEVKECSFKPRVNCSSSSSKHFNNISNISAISLLPKGKPSHGENASSLQNTLTLAGQGRPLIEKWKEQVREQSVLIGDKMESMNSHPIARPVYNRLSKPIRNIKANPIHCLSNDCTSREESSERKAVDKAHEFQEYLRLMAVADSLFEELKCLKESNRQLAARLRTTKQLR